MDATTGTPSGWQTEMLLASTDDAEEFLQSDFRWFSFGDCDRPMVRAQENVFQNDTLRVARISSTGYEIARSEERFIVFTTPLCGQVNLNLPHAEFTLEPGDLLINPPNHPRLTSRAPKRAIHEHLGIEILSTTMEAWDDVLSNSARREGGAKQFTLHRSPPEARALVAALKLVAGCVGDQGPLRDEAGVSALLMERILDLREAMSPGRTRPGSLRQLKAAEHFIHAHFRQPLSTPLIARQAGLSIRGLQAVFLRHRGVTPLTYLRRVRLEAAHAELAASRGERRVTKVALDCGFLHLSRFAAAYRERFGQPPSERWRDTALVSIGAARASR